MEKSGGYLVLVVLFGLVSLTFVLALPTITISTGESSFNFNDSISNFYNISVNNSDIGLTANISQVNITLWGNLNFTTGTNGTDASLVTFSNTSTVLSWTNSSTTALINASEEIKYFWFNASSNTPGTYNISIITRNLTGTSTTNISVTINDTTSPSLVEFVSPTETHNSNNSQTYINYNISVIDNGAISTIFVKLYNSTNDEINSSNSTSSPFTGNFSSLANGVYYINATVNDTFNNLNTTVQTRNITLDTVAPSIGFTCSPTSVSTGATITCSCSATDTYTSNVTPSFTTSPSTSDTGTYSTTCTATDSAGNSASSSISYTVEIAGTSSGTTTTTTTTTTTVSDADIQAGSTKNIAVNTKLTFNIKNESHSLTLKELTSTTAKIDVASTTQTVTMSINETKRFEISNDTFYDLKVTLNSIANNKANFTIIEIHEEVPIEERTQTPEAGADADATADDGTDLSETTTNIGFWVIIIIGVIILLAIIGYFLKKEKTKDTNNNFNNPIPKRKTKKENNKKKK
ncbi:hypothetical protein HOD75_01325 [archaeon]|jgi:hypothetical protein|nr:hypothetical protein [archaeon]MBT4241519.1 hypothetical protein [archaeon]MBT4417610.1 hypothetical protein [archaeon]